LSRRAIGEVWPHPYPGRHSYLHCVLSLNFVTRSTKYYRLGVYCDRMSDPQCNPSVRFLTKFRTLPHQQLRQCRANSAMTDTSPTTENRTLRRLPNSAYRVREYLTEKEVDRLIEAARKRGRNGARDAAAIRIGGGGLGLGGIIFAGLPGSDTGGGRRLCS